MVNRFTLTNLEQVFLLLLGIQRIMHYTQLTSQVLYYLGNLQLVLRQSDVQIQKTFLVPR